MKIKIITEIDSMFSLKEKWDILFQEGEYSFFQRFEYCYNSVLINKSELYLIALYNEDDLIEIWPCEVISGNIRFINDTHADFCDILSNNSGNEVIEYLTLNNRVSLLRLKNIKLDSKVYTKINQIDCLSVISETHYSRIYLRQTDKFPANFEHFVYRQRRRLKRILKMYDAQISLLSINCSPFPLEDILILRRSMIDSGIRNERFLDKNFLKLIEILYNSSGLNVSKVVYNDDVVAISLIFKQKDSYFFWVDLYNDLKMINLYHNIQFIKSITKLSAATFNFGRGVYNYKLQNFVPELKILVDFSTFENKCTMYIFLLKNRLRRIIKVAFDFFKN